MSILKIIKYFVCLNIFLLSSLSTVTASNQVEVPEEPVEEDARFINNALSENSIVIDGNLEDWSTVPSLGYDSETLQGEGIKADIVRGWIAHDNNHLYVAYENSIEINTAVRWPWQVFFDTDESSTNGYKVNDNLNADYMLQGAGLYKYIDNDSIWPWQYILHIDNAVLGTIAEFKIPRLALGSPERLIATFTTKNVAFTGSYDQSGVDVYPKAMTPIPLHNTLLRGQSFVWGEPGGILEMSLSEAADAGANQLQTIEVSSLVDNQLITYRSNNDEYYTAQIASTDGNTINLIEPLAMPIAEGQNLWNFYNDGSHANTVGTKAIVDFMIREVGFETLSTGKHVLFGDSWIDSPPPENMAAWLSERLADAIIIDKGVGGNTTEGLLARFDADVSPESPDFVWVLVGINDAFSKIPVADYLANMQEIITKIKALGATPLILDSQVAPLFFDQELGNDFRTNLTHGYSEELAKTDALVRYQLTESIIPPPEDAIFNLKSIVIDGELTDWEELQMFSQDADDISVAESKADFLEAGMAHDDTHFYIMYRNDSEIDTAAWWNWRIYLDTDNIQRTGYQAGNGIGSDYIIQGGNLYQYTGAGYNWDWTLVEWAENNVNSDVAELKFSRSSINNPSSLSMIFKASNGYFTDDYSSLGVDSYPDLNQGHFDYRFDQSEPVDLEQ